VFAAQLFGTAVRPLIPALTRRTFGRAIIEGGFIARPSRMPASQAAGDALAFLRTRDTVRTILAGSVSFTEPVPADVPVTIAWGAKDRVLPPRQALVAVGRLPGARFVPLPGCGHVPMTDDPALVAKVLLNGSALA
jgi:pimeloyl-ACP methyl ester carboxylesterase